LPWRGGRGAGKRVPPPPPRRRRPAGVLQRLRTGPSPRRAAQLRAADKAHGRADGIDHRATGRLQPCGKMALETGDVPPQEKLARRHDHPRVFAGASNPEVAAHGRRAHLGGGGGGRGAGAVWAL